MKREHIQTQHENKNGSDPGYWQDIVVGDLFRLELVVEPRWDLSWRPQLVGRLVSVVQSKCRRQVVDDDGCTRMAINKDNNRFRREQEESKRQGAVELRAG